MERWKAPKISHLWDLILFLAWPCSITHATLLAWVLSCVFSPLLRFECWSIHVKPSHRKQARGQKERDSTILSQNDYVCIYTQYMLPFYVHILSYNIWCIIQHCSTCLHVRSSGSLLSSPEVKSLRSGKSLEQGQQCPDFHGVFALKGARWDKVVRFLWFCFYLSFVLKSPSWKPSKSRFVPGLGE